MNFPVQRSVPPPTERVEPFGDDFDCVRNAPLQADRVEECLKDHRQFFYEVRGLMNACFRAAASSAAPRNVKSKAESRK